MMQSKISARKKESESMFKLEREARRNKKMALEN